MEKKDLKGFEYIGDVPAYNKMMAQREYLPLYLKLIKGIKFFATEKSNGLEPVVLVEKAYIETYRKDQFEYNATCNDYLFLRLPAL